MKSLTNSFTFFFLILLAGCSDSPPPRAGEDVATFGIISDRRDVPPNVSYTLIYRLKKPALFASASRGGGGGLIIDEGVREALEREQQEFRQKLVGISPEIKIIYTYRFVLNAMAVSVPSQYWQEIASLSSVSMVRRQKVFPRPTFEDSPAAEKDSFADETTSVEHIGIEKVHGKYNLKGQGIKIGIIDTGIDYTHAALGGSGSKQAYLGIDPSEESNHFPNEKVVGGIDLVGSYYNPGVGYPTPDGNPIDEGAHGTHVAATAGGAGDGINVYTGVAPEAQLYAIKVFGAGGTSDAAVIAALEYAADPNRDGDPSDRIDVLNLSLGSNYGSGVDMYSRAVSNASKAGIMTVIAAGNSGDNSYIVAAPSTSQDSLSVASSVDAMRHNWIFKAIEFELPGGEIKLAERIEGEIGRPISSAKVTRGKIVYVGMANEKISKEVAKTLKGNIALVDRGGKPFLEKVQRVQWAGAVGAIVANNEPGSPIVMEGGYRLRIPAVMIEQGVGEAIKKALERGEVVVELDSDKTVEKKELIDTIAVFSSRGPRLFDSGFKPEIAAPGQNILSAAAGTGNEGRILSGTSMAAPHAAGAMALLRQHFPLLAAGELKALLMNKAKPMRNVDGKRYSGARQGAGRLQLLPAIEATFLATPGALAFGKLGFSDDRTVEATLSLKNISDAPVTLTFGAEDFALGLTLVDPPIVYLAAGSKKDVAIALGFERTALPQSVEDFSGFVEGILTISNDGGETSRVPIFALRRLFSQIQPSSLYLGADSKASLSMVSQGDNFGIALPFNLLGMDEKKAEHRYFPLPRDIYSRDCDMESVGYRIVTRSVGDEKDGSVKSEKFFQVATKIYSPLTRWNRCHISVQFDTDADGLPEQELVGIHSSELSGLGTVMNPGFYSLLIDTAKARESLDYFASLSYFYSLDFSQFLLDKRPLEFYDNASLAIVETSLDKLALAKDGKFHIKVGTLDYNEYVVNTDDFLGAEWFALSPDEKKHGYYGMPEVFSMVSGPESVSADFKKGTGSHSLIVYAPLNEPDWDHFIPEIWNLQEDPRLGGI